MIKGEYLDRWRRGKEGRKRVKEGWNKGSKEECFDGWRDKGRRLRVEGWSELSRVECFDR